MMDPVLIDVTAFAMLRIVAWANVGFAAAMALGVVLWLASAWRDVGDPLG